MYIFKYKRNLVIIGGVVVFIIVVSVVVGLIVGKIRCIVNIEGYLFDVVDYINVNIYMVALYFSIFVESIFNIYDFFILLTVN